MQRGGRCQENKSARKKAIFNSTAQCAIGHRQARKLDEQKVQFRDRFGLRNRINLPQTNGNISETSNSTAFNKGPSFYFHCQLNLRICAVAAFFDRY